MRILLINQDWFAKEFREAGHDVIVTGFGRNFEVKLPTPVIHIDSVIKSLPRPFEPDVIIVYDESSPILVSGLEETEIPTIFYSVDTHHHAPFHRYLAHTFDCTLVAQSDYRPLFEEVGISPVWFPLWASRFVEATDERRHDVCFVGTMDRRLNPERVDFFEALAKEVPILLAHGQYWDYFPFSRLVINQTVKGDLNFRVFEAMMCGTTLLTERQGNGLLELFKDGEHLVTYEKGNVRQVTEVIRSLLSDTPRCRRIAEAGRAEILQRHLPIHRATQLLTIARNLEKKRYPLRRFGAMVNLSNLANLAADYDKSVAARALLYSLRAGEAALEGGELCNNEVACYLIRAALAYDALLGSHAGKELIARCAEHYSGVPFFSLAYVRTLLNSGQKDAAVSVIKERLSHVPEDKAFHAAEELISTLIQPKF